MNIFNKVTMASLEKNKTRTAVTVVGIVLSAAMLCAVTTLIASLQDYLLRVMIYDSGDWYGCVHGVDGITADEIKSDSDVTAAYNLQSIGYAVLENCENDGKPYIFLAGADKDFTENMPVHLIDGEMPQSSTEVLIPEHIQYNGGVDIKIGDTLTLNIGDRVAESGGAALSQSTPFIDGEVLEVRETRTYTVCGIYSRPSFEGYTAPGYTALTVPNTDGSPLTDVYFKTQKAGDVYDFLKKWDGATETNSDVLMALGESGFSGFYTVLYSMAAIFIAIIMFGSVSLIYNAFAISVSERTKYFGILSSVGAEKRQIRKSVFFEAAFVSAVGIPVGILCGVGGIAVTLKLLTGSLEKILGYGGVNMHLKVTPLSVLIAAAVAFITVMISAWIPSRRAEKVSAIEAIRQSGDVKTEKKGKAKSFPLTYKLFGIEGVIAGKYFKRSRKKYRATVVSLFMSVVLFISASSFCSYLAESVSGVKDSFDYDISYRYNDNDASNKDTYALLAATDGVSASSRVKYVYTLIDIPTEVMTEEGRALYDSADGGMVEISALIYGIDSSEYAEYLSSRGLDSNKYSGENPAGIACGRVRGVNLKEEKYVMADLFSSSEASAELLILDDAKVDALEKSGAFDTADAEESQALIESCYNRTQLYFGDITDSLVFGLNNRKGWDVIVMYPMEYLEKVFEDDLTEINYFKADDHKSAYEAMKTKLDGIGMKTVSSGYSDNLYDRWTGSEADQSLLTIIRVFSYGFIVLISLIATANVFNTVSTNIMLRRREFAMLKSIGMTSGGFNRMMNYECILYGAKSLLLGIPVSFAVTYIIYLSVQSGIEMEFSLPWTAVTVAVLSVFAVVFATMMYSMRKIKRKNTMDALRNENL